MSSLSARDSLATIASMARCCVKNRCISSTNASTSGRRSASVIAADRALPGLRGRSSLRDDTLRTVRARMSQPSVVIEESARSITSR
jgi:hypothetical protein